MNGIEIQDFYVDTEYSEILDTTEKILGALCYIGIGIPMIAIYWLFIKKQPYIMPYSYVNYISANYKNIIDEIIEQENIQMCNRWNYQPCDCSFPRV